LFLITLITFISFNPFIAFAQNIPFHSDPNARVEAIEASSLPAIRFLTGADFAPFNFQNKEGKLVGFHLDLIKEICNYLDIACTVQEWPWDQIENALSDNQGDAMLAGLAITNESAKKFDFSDIYMMFPARFVVLKENIENFDANMLDGKKISTRKNSNHEKFLQKYLPNAKIVEAENEIEALKAIQVGLADVYFGDAMRASFWLNENPLCCSFAGKAYFNAQYFGEGLAIALPISRPAVRDGLNYALAQLKKNGKLDELYLRWFPVSFY